MKMQILFTANKKYGKEALQICLAFNFINRKKKPLLIDSSHGIQFYALNLKVPFTLCENNLKDTNLKKHSQSIIGNNRCNNLSVSLFKFG